MAASAYWYAEANNFGDLLAPLLLKHFSLIETDWAPPESAEIVCAGSVLDVVPDGWEGTVLGSGMLHGRPRDLSRATVLGLRGPLTAKACKTGHNGFVLGDPGLLASELVTTRPIYELGLVPHWTDTELFAREDARSIRDHYARPRLIDPTRPLMEVISEIGSCRKIISSSLHGIIVADSFGIPRRAERFPHMDDPHHSKHEGSDFKFDDYSSSIEMPIEWGKLQEADSNKVQRIMYELFDVFQDLAGLYGEEAA
jgi:pyruvyltransferase